MITLPISGRELALRELSGADALLLLEPSLDEGERMRDLLAAAARVAPGDIESLPAGDAELLLLLLRRSLLGGTIVAEARCTSPACGARIDVSFAIDTYLRHHRPRPEDATPGEDGWFALGDAAFRMPTVRDQLESSREPAADRALLARCVRNASGASLRKITALLTRIAPTMSDYVGGTCPECGTAVTVYFDVAAFVLQELRAVAAEVYDHVHLLASHYGWSEPEILALPRSRRAAYVARVARELAS
jgi:hypothetical protein